MLPIESPDVSWELNGQVVSLRVTDGFALTPPGEPSLPWLCVFVAEERIQDGPVIQLVATETEAIALPAPLASAVADVETRDLSNPALVWDEIPSYDDRAYPDSNCRIGEQAVWQGRRVTIIYWCPFRYFPQENRLEIIRRGVLVTANDHHGIRRDPENLAPLAAVGFSDLRELSREIIPSARLWRTADFASGRTVAVGLPTDVDYLIITTEQLLPSFRPLAEWRLKQGYRAGVALLENIAQAYEGVDLQSRIRSYIADAYAGGLRFCLLGGDETIVPIRYAYHAYADTMPPYDRMQICDLYYADLNGDWDTDGDEIYGEYLQDNADLLPEVCLGRVPAATAEQATTIVDKILEYETSPGDPDYLTRALFSCADQMRDWNGGEGQHAIIGANFPSRFMLDLTSQSENPFGSLPDPALPEGAEFVEQAGAGWGWTIILNHGRTDGFVLRSAGINQWPKSYVWSSGADGDGHGHLNLLPASSSPGIFASVSCDIGGIDMDGPLFGGSYGPNVTETLLHHPTGGAAAVIAYSRWGWVASSYRIIGKLVEYAFDPQVPSQIGVAFTLAKASFPYYRDQNYGLNLYGDPAMTLWTGQPQVMNVEFPLQVAAGSGAVEFSVAHEGSALPGVTVTAAYGDTVFFTGETDASGTATWTAGPDRLGGYAITVTKAGYLPVRSQLITPIASGIDEDDSPALPLALEQNHPNPFNPITTIGFAVPAADHARLEVFDILGRRINALVDGILPPGRYQVEFPGEDAQGAPLASGVYFYRLQAGRQTIIRKMVLLR